MFKAKEKRRSNKKRSLFKLIFDLDQKPLTRYVYLMERVTNRDWESIRRGRREIKIGVAKNSEERHNTVDKGIPGIVIILAEYHIEGATRTEAELHELFKDYRFKVKGAKRGSGSTEFFRLKNWQVRKAKRILRSKSTNPFIRYWWFFVFLFPPSLVYLIHVFLI